MFQIIKNKNDMFPTISSFIYYVKHTNNLNPVNYYDVSS